MLFTTSTGACPSCGAYRSDHTFACRRHSGFRPLFDGLVQGSFRNATRDALTSRIVRTGDGKTEQLLAMRLDT